MRLEDVRVGNEVIYKEGIELSLEPVQIADGDIIQVKDLLFNLQGRLLGFENFSDIMILTNESTDLDIILSLIYVVQLTQLRELTRSMPIRRNIVEEVQSILKT